MATFDWVVIGLVLFGAFWGYMKGFVSEISSISALLIGFLSVKFYKPSFEKYLNNLEQLSDYIFFVPIIASISLFVLGYFVTKIVALVLKKIIHRSPIKSVDNWGGLALGAIKWFICVLIFVFATLEFKIPKLVDIVHNSKTGNYLHGVAKVVATILL